MKKVLSLDLGITTGYAVQDLSGDLLDYGEILEDMFTEQLKELRDKWIPSYSVAEKPVIMRGKLGDRLEKVVLATQHELMHQVSMVDPVRWKDSPARKHQAPRGTSQHVKDAIRLGVWYLSQLQGVKEGS